MICTNCKRRNAAPRTFCAACGKPLPPIGAEQYPSGTSSAVGPSFFAGQIGAPRSNRPTREVTDSLRGLGWVSLAAAALLIVAVLEWQTWRSPTFTAAGEKVAVAQSSTDGPSHTDSQPPLLNVRTTSAPTSVRTVAAHVTTMQSVIPATGDVSATPSLSSTTQKLQSAPVVTPEQTELDSGSPEVRLLLAAVGKGDANAPVSLANMYLEGKGVSRSCDQALSLLQSAAAKPNARARNRLAAMYEIGTCVQRDRVQAYRWLTAALAVDSNNPWAQQNRDQTWREMTSEERTIAEAYR